MIKSLKFAAIISLFGLSSVFAQKGNSFTVEGTLKGLQEGGYVYMSHKWNDVLLVDSAKINSSSFKFKGSTPEPNMYWIYDSPKSQNFLIFFVEKGTVSVFGELKDLANAEVKGSSVQRDYFEYRLIMKDFEEKKNEMGLSYQQAQQSGDMNKMTEIQQSYGVLVTNQIAKTDKFIENHPKSVVGAYAIWSTINEEPDLPKIEKQFEALSPDVKKTKFGKLVSEKIASVKGTIVGNTIMDFSQNDANGKPVSITSFKGKVVLVDFWASWCGPCRKENPNVVKAYQAFKDKGFDIIGVSFDNSKDKWLAAVEKDGLTWTHVSDLKGWNNEVGVKFGIKSIPQNFLIDKDGKILAKNLRGEELYAKLQEILN